MKDLLYTTFSDGYGAMLIRFAICMIVNWIIVDRLYYTKSRRRDFYFTFMIISVAIFFLVFFMIFVLEDLKTKTSIGLGIGLFGTTIDEESAAMLDYGSTGLNLMACYSYYRDRRSQRRLYEKEHEYFYQDTETEQGKPVWHKEIFELEDPEMNFLVYLSL